MATVEIRDPPASAEVEQEFERLYRRYVGDVLAYSGSVLGASDQAEDIAQSTFLKAYRALVDGVGPEDPREWLIAIARNECELHFRAVSRRPREVTLDKDLAAPENGDATASEVRRALEQLGDNQRQALVLREFEGRSYEEIATALDLSGSAVETLLFRARRALREQFEAAGGCAHAQRLIAASGTLSDDERAHLRAHVRSCSDCATLERKQRGLRSMLARVASLFPLPSWLPSFFGGAAAKTTAAVTVAAIGTGGAVTVVASSDHHARPTPTPQVHTVTNPWRTPAAGPGQTRAGAPAASGNAARRSKPGTRVVPGPRAARQRVALPTARQSAAAPAAAQPPEAAPQGASDPPAVQPPAAPLTPGRPAVPAGRAALPGHRPPVTPHVSHPAPPVTHRVSHPAPPVTHHVSHPAPPVTAPAAPAVPAPPVSTHSAPVTVPGPPVPKPPHKP